MKRILITGKNSYIGTSVERRLLKEPHQYQINSLDMKGESWKRHDFSKYDVVFHVAGIAHVSTNPKMEQLYYSVNRDLAIEVARRAKEASVRQFIFMSSIIVYGESNNKSRVIDLLTVPKPSNFYGDSKLQAEKGIKELESIEFKIVILRPPMIYGKGSKGNYPKLAKFAKISPIFVDYENRRSMLHIDNLCEFIKLMIDNKESGTFYPQNKEYVATTDLVRLIRKTYGKKLYTTKLLNWLINILNIRVLRKMFGSLVYDFEMSEYESNVYQVRNLEESIFLTEMVDINET